jgi:branched-chain amino acid transport system substrate-binding protein
VKIVSSLPRTGAASEETAAVDDAIRLTLEEHRHRAGEILVDYDGWDDGAAQGADWDPERERANAQRAAADPAIVVYLGPYNSGAARIAMPILNEAGLAMISMSSTYPGLTKPGLGQPGEPGAYRRSGTVSYFRVVPADDVQGRLAAGWMHDLGGASVVVVDDGSLYGRIMADAFQAGAELAPVGFIGRLGFDPARDDPVVLMKTIAASAPAWVYFGGSIQTGCAAIVRAASTVIPDTKVMLPDGCFDPSFVSAAGASADGRTHLTTGAIPVTELSSRGRAFADGYRERFGREPTMNAVLANVAVEVALDAIARAGRDRAAVLRAVASTELAESAVGPFRFDAEGDTTLTLAAGYRVAEGKLEFATVLTRERR